VEGVTSEMRRILDIDKLQDDRGKRQKKNNYWQRIRNDPARRKQYAFKRNQDIGGLLGLGDRV